MLLAGFYPGVVGIKPLYAATLAWPVLAPYRQSRPAQISRALYFRDLHVAQTPMGSVGVVIKWWVIRAASATCVRIPAIPAF